MNGIELMNISDYLILPHCRKRWKKRWLDFTPKGEKRLRKIEELIKEPMCVIREYDERGTLRVTDYRYEFVVDPVNKVIITMNAYQRKTDRSEYIKKKRMLIENETISRFSKTRSREWQG